MRNSFGKNIIFTIFGESHSDQIGIVIDGLKAGLELPFELIDKMLAKRRPAGDISTARREPDVYEVVSGYFNNHTTGAPLCITLPNVMQQSKDYEKNRFMPRPSHADYTAYIKYGGYADYRGGGQFSGRLTAPIVVAGAICTSILSKRGIKIATHIKSLMRHTDTDFDANSIATQLELLDVAEFPCLDRNVADLMKAEILKAKSNGDSVGGVLESIVVGLPAGVGEPFFNSVESVLSSLLFSIPAVKGVEFGLGFEFDQKYGSVVNDEFILDNGIKTKTNNCGGICGGISNGMPITLKCVVKPTPSIAVKQQTVDLSTNQECELVTTGRHDPCIIHRASVVVDSMLAIGLLDLLIEQDKARFFTEE